MHDDADTQTGYKLHKLECYGGILGRLLSSSGETYELIDDDVTIDGTWIRHYSVDSNQTSSEWLGAGSGSQSG